jgi:hypothetical protein
MRLSQADSNSYKLPTILASGRGVPWGRPHTPPPLRQGRIVGQFIAPPGERGSASRTRSTLPPARRSVAAWEGPLGDGPTRRLHSRQPWGWQLSAHPGEATRLGRLADLAWPGFAATSWSRNKQAGPNPVLKVGVNLKPDPTLKPRPRSVFPLPAQGAAFTFESRPPRSWVSDQNGPRKRC